MRYAIVNSPLLTLLGTMLLVCALSVDASTPRIHSGIVTRVVDGDTVWVQTTGRDALLKVRLQGIDAPEICQAGGRVVYAALKSRILGQRVTVMSWAYDNHGRMVGTLYWQGQDMGRWLVANGYAWVYSFHQKKGPYADEFIQAQTARRGVFGDGQAEEPRVFRRRNGSCYSNQNRPPSETSSGVEPAVENRQAGLGVQVAAVRRLAVSKLDDGRILNFL